MSHLLLHGNAYAQIMRDGGGRVRALHPLLPHKMDVCRSDAGELYYTYWRNYDETRPGEKSGGVALKREQVLHIPGLSQDGLVGLSPIALARNAIGLAIATEQYGAGFFANGAHPGGILEHPGPLGEGKDELLKRVTVANAEAEFKKRGHNRGHNQQKRPAQSPKD